MNFQKLFPKIVISTFLIIAFFSYSCEKKRETTNTSESLYNKQQVDKYYQLANKYYDNSKYDSAFYYANKIRLEINPATNLDQYATNMYIIIASQRMGSDYSGAENSIVEALSFIEKTNSTKQKRKFNSLLAYNYMCQKNYIEARHYYKKASLYNVDKRLKLLSIINIGHTYKEEKQYKTAINILIPLLKENEIQKDKNYKAGILNDLGYCYFKQGYPNAIKYLKQSLYLNSNLGPTAEDDYDLTANYYYLSEYYSKKNEDEAFKYANLLYQKATQYNNPDDRLLALSLLIKHSTGNELKKYSLNYIHLNDSITKVRQNAKNYFAKLKYDSKKEKEENIKLKAEKELQQELEKNKNIIISFIITLIIILAGFIYYYLLQKSNKEKLTTAYNTEIRIAKKLHDELANDVYQTIVFAETQDLSSPGNKEKLLDNLDIIYSNTRNISKENSPVETGDYFSSTLKEMISEFNSNSVNIVINGLDEINWTAFEDLKKISIYRILQELLVNMKKHSQCSLTIISFKKNDTTVQINYYDNGIGIPLEKTKIKNGLQNVENRIFSIKGTINFDTKTNKGLKINIIIPILPLLICSKKC
jgi:signal transduction histidine kinase